MGLSFTKLQNLRLLQIQRVYRKTLILVQMVRFVFRSTVTIVGRRKYWLPAFSPFPTILTKGFFPRVNKTQNCFVKDLIIKNHLYQQFSEKLYKLTKRDITHLLKMTK